ncbi:hypothetical protein OnM2_06583 [Erysiphe neolycopersici]|uniref:Uncharacterized protein n=1 Tax=Erysiphe neolycopersici TaxID=212602 RepID=A0A420H774_9PEZI|nr:hypothetical protein OnM2_06583 [Erysiphe neolycopersici]
MRVFDISSLSIGILFLSLLWAGKTVAIIEDAYGKSNYGIKCGYLQYTQHDIYAAAKTLCDAKIKNATLTYELNDIGDQQLLIKILHLNFEENYAEPFSIIPIFADGLLYPIENKTLSSEMQSKLEKEHGVLVVDKNCKVMSVLYERPALLKNVFRFENCEVF